MLAIAQRSPSHPLERGGGMHGPQKPSFPILIWPIRPVRVSALEPNHCRLRPVRVIVPFARKYDAQNLMPSPGSFLWTCTLNMPQKA